MLKRLTATAAAILLLTTLDSMSAYALVGRVSGAFRLQTGVDSNGSPVYNDCGQLRLYKTDTNREWRLEGTCHNLIDVVFPTTATPSPMPTGTPRLTVPTPGWTPSLPSTPSQRLIGRFSGAFRIQVGVDSNGSPMYTDCGRLHLYKTDTGPEWHLEDTCDQLIDVMFPTGATPSPMPTGTPRLTIPTPGWTPSSPSTPSRRLIGRFSGAFRIQIGVDGNGAPVYTDCGQLHLYKTDTGPEWHLEDTCDQLIDVVFPTGATPSPMPTGTPRFPLPTPSPTPSPAATNPMQTATADCPDGFFSKVSATRWTLSNVSLTVGEDYRWCVDLPALRSRYFEIFTVNKANTQCSEVSMTAISPLGAEYFDQGWQPGVEAAVSPGRWQVQMHLYEGCSRYDVILLYY